MSIKQYKVEAHVLVPRHSKLSEKEKAEVLEEFQITINALPAIFINDPAVKELNFKQGDVVKIVRKSQTTGETVFYRVVTDV